MGAIPAGGTRRVYGKAHWDGSRWYAVVGDNILDCRWAASVHPRPGLNLIIDISDDGRGQSSAVVMDSYEDQPRPTTGTVTGIVPAGASWRITFNGDDGKPYSTDRFIGSYDVGDPVDIRWDGTTAIIQGKIQSIAPPTVVPLPPKPTADPVGTTTLIATASDTYAAGVWGQYGGGGEVVYSNKHSNAAQLVQGAWFYGIPKPVLAGKTITRIRFRLPDRVRGDGADHVILYSHNFPSRPAGALTTNYSPSLHIALARANAAWHDLPLTFGNVLRNGGGIVIESTNLIGYTSRLKDPASGQILIDWSV